MVYLEVATQYTVTPSTPSLWEYKADLKTSRGFISNLQIQHNHVFNQVKIVDDAVYNASQAAMGGGGGTLDKRGGLRDELGYIAPPNRKLPPVPGSNYNTCDRVKRQAVISEYSKMITYALHTITLLVSITY